MKAKKYTEEVIREKRINRKKMNLSKICYNF
jgi:hypothetical protein